MFLPLLSWFVYGSAQLHTFVRFLRSSFRKLLRFEQFRVSLGILTEKNLSHSPSSRFEVHGAASDSENSELLLCIHNNCVRKKNYYVTKCFCAPKFDATELTASADLLCSCFANQVCRRVSASASLYIIMYSTLKKVPDLSYRSHKLQTATADAGYTKSFESFDIRPAYLDRGPFVDPSQYVVTPKSIRSGLTAISVSCQQHNNSRKMTSLSSSDCELSVNGVTGVTGIPNLVELDDAFNTLDPGQLLRESAAAATRAALLSETPKRLVESAAVEPIQYTMERRRMSSSSILVDDLLQQIYRQSNSNNDVDDDHDETFAASSFVETSKKDSTNCAPGSHFSSKCSDPLKKKGGNSKLILLSLHCSLSHGGIRHDSTSFR